MAYSPDEQRIATAGADGIVQIYTTDMDELLQIAESRVTRQLTAEEKEKYGVLDLNWYGSGYFVSGIGNLEGAVIMKLEGKLQLILFQLK